MVIWYIRYLDIQQKYIVLSNLILTTKKSRHRNPVEQKREYINRHVCIGTRYTINMALNISEKRTIYLVDGLPKNYHIQR